MAEKAVFMSKRFSELKIVYNVGGTQRKYDKDTGLVIGEFPNLPARHIKFEKHKYETDDPTIISILENQPSFDSPEMCKKYPDEAKMFYRLGNEELKVINDAHLILKLREEKAELTERLRQAEEIAFPGGTAPPIVDGARGTARGQQARAAVQAPKAPDMPQPSQTEEKVPQEPSEAQPVPFECPVPPCKYVGKSKQGLRMHMTKKHPQK